MIFALEKFLQFFQRIHFQTKSILKFLKFSLDFLLSMFIPILKRMKRPTKTIEFLNFSSFRILCGFRVLW
ncbi:hypothetical protein B2G50_14015 [Leptospira interrogans serovar Canicola]|nr:hypothetical protein B2G50_14015 [Leptospira interrogans serovar Canicola]